jgi:EAL domain-containing protein (putative c-di-GMP-specific phosphodiesterase class I)
MLLEQGLREAIDAGRLTLEFQPIVDLSGSRPDSLEALARWDHPTLGRIPPSEFIHVAEECGLIVELGDQVLRLALDQVARWREADPAGPRPGLSVNLSRQQLLVPGLPRRTTEAVRSRGLDPGDIQLEITEGAMMTNPAAAGEAIRALREAGFRLAIDDFGTGYSSLACLHEFSFDLLKIDRSFIQGLGQVADRAALVQTITAMARMLGFGVVAEGIETSVQLDLVRRLGCEYGQGFFFARPMPPEEAWAWLRARTEPGGALDELGREMGSTPGGRRLEEPCLAEAGD